ncbi:CsiV family protein [Thiomicrorhabdus sediminis]|uniref:Peptidoglycan-binding protein, CsiV n=1 Tax=Thiomicrorhabdus sediminis TaxID=2580412 RepID=A0A4P9K5X8_9GAMM|nr:CsiV family protein [Thiomicrorhabdus sediminis]QCU90221.1 hypothetical protein FE785_06055 [Thiomicrorhabdus sediminis]
MLYQQFQNIKINTKSKIKLLAHAVSYAFLMLFASHAAQANSEQASYKIEVIVFESLALKGWTEEYWPEEIEHPIIENSTPLSSKDKPPLWLSLQDRDMNDNAAKLSKRGYRVLFHQAWSQLAPSNSNAPTVMIENESQYGTTMLGTVRLYKTRFAHVDFDLEFDRRIPDKILNQFLEKQNLANTIVSNNMDSSNVPQNWAFHLSDSRKIKPGELHYIDHPLFGILVQISTLN